MWSDGILREFEDREELDREDYDSEEEFAEDQKDWKPIWVNGPTDRVYVYYGTSAEPEDEPGTELIIAQTIAEAFKNEGFELEWNGTTNTAICVVIADDFAWPGTNQAVSSSEENYF